MKLTQRQKEELTATAVVAIAMLTVVLTVS